jgi:hypothetical protein
MKQVVTFGLTLGLLAGGVGMAGASTITWGGGALAGNGTSTISTSGAFVEAHNVGDVTPIAAGPITFDGAGTDPFGNTYADFLEVGLTGNAAFDSVLDSGSWADGPANYHISGLTIGNSYLAQFFVADTRECCNYNARTVTVTAGNSSTSGLLGAGWVFNGTFVADATTQDVSFDGGHGFPDDNVYAYLNAYQLRDITASGRGVDIDAVPEPATLVLCSVGVLFAATRLRRRK